MTRSPWETRRTTVVHNLLQAYEHTSESAHTDGLAWYPKARQIVSEWADHYRLPLNTVASVIAAISPQCDWERNLIIADDVLADRAISVNGVLLKNLGKARRIRAEATGQLADMMRYFPYGPKVNCFAWNLAGHDNIVTIDTHATQAALNDVQTHVTLKWVSYKIVAECYATAAARVHHTPAAFQAIVWCSWKERYPRMRKHAMRRQW